MACCSHDLAPVFVRGVEEKIWSPLSPLFFEIGLSKGQSGRKWDRRFVFRLHVSNRKSPGGGWFSQASPTRFAAQLQAALNSQFQVALPPSKILPIY